MGRFSFLLRPIFHFKSSGSPLPHVMFPCPKQLVNFGERNVPVFVVCPLCRLPPFPIPPNNCGRDPFRRQNNFVAGCRPNCLSPTALQQPPPFHGLPKALQRWLPRYQSGRPVSSHFLPVLPCQQMAPKVRSFFPSPSKSLSDFSRLFFF